MSNYSKTTDFEAKDSLPTGDSGKIIRGSEFETEFDAISTAIATKADTAGPTFTGTLTFETISDGTINVTAFVDEDDMSSNSATLVPTQQSVKAYVDSQLTAQDLDFQADSGGALSIDLDSETMTFTGGTGIDTSGSGNAVTFAIDSTVATLTGTQTLTNKTLTSPDVNTPDIDGGTIDNTVIGGSTAAAGSFTTVSATGNITVGGTVDGRDVATDGSKLDGIEASATADQTASEIRTLVESASDSNVFTDADHSKLDGIEASADVTDATNVTAAGALMDSELTSIASVKALNQGVSTSDSPTFAGLTTTANVSFGDNDRAVFGAGSDLQIYHDGSNSFISDQGSGSLVLRGSTAINLQNGAGTEYLARFFENGSVNLYHDGAQKLVTTSTGIDVTGVITTDGLTTSADINFGDNDKAVFGADSDMSLFHNGNNGFLDCDTGTLFIQTDSLSVKNSAGTEVQMLAAADGAVALYHNNSAKLATTSTGIDVTGTAVTDGLTVDGNSLLKASGTNTTPLKVFSASSATDNTTTIELGDFTGSGAFEVSRASIIGQRSGSSLGGVLKFTTGESSAGTLKTRLEIADNGDISFFEDTGTTAKFFFDASAEALILGANFSSSDKFEIRASSGQESGIRLANNASSDFRIFNNGSNALQFNIGTSTAAMLMDSSGNLGIGTTSPNFLLDVEGSGSLFRINATSGDATAQFSVANTTSLNTINFGDSGSTTSGQILYRHNGDSMAFNVGGAEAIRILDGGNVGIGTSSPAAPLSIEGSSTGEYDALILRNSNSAASGQSTAMIFEVSAGTSGDEAASVAKISALRTGSGSKGDLLFHTTLSGTSSEHMRILSSGNVGIGTSSPTAPVDVRGANSAVHGRGQIYISNTETAAINQGSQISFGATYQGTTQSFVASVAGRKENSTSGDYAGYLQFSTRPNGGSNTERARFDSSGNFLVGTTSSVGGRIQAERTLFSDSGNDNWKKGAFVATGSFGGAISLINSGGGSDGFAFYLTGTPSVLNVQHGSDGGTMANGVKLSSTATAWAAYSDSRLKTITSEISNAIASVNTLRAVKYTLNNDDENTPRVGLIAQEVQEVLPEAVEVVDDDGHLGLRYTEIIPLLVAAIKEQQTTIQDLKARILTLEGEN